MNYKRNQLTFVYENYSLSRIKKDLQKIKLRRIWIHNRAQTVHVYISPVNLQQSESTGLRTAKFFPISITVKLDLAPPPKGAISAAVSTADACRLACCQERGATGGEFVRGSRNWSIRPPPAQDSPLVQLNPSTVGMPSFLFHFAEMVLRCSTHWFCNRCASGCDQGHSVSRTESRRLVRRYSAGAYSIPPWIFHLGQSLSKVSHLPCLTSGS